MGRSFHPWIPLIAATAAAVGGVVAGVFYAARRDHVRIAIPLSGGLLLGVALFGLLPELAANISWTLALLWFAGGFVLLSVIDQIASICPTCSDAHDHRHCSEPLHGFAAPILFATGLHALFDGWALTAAGSVPSVGIRVALPIAMVLHKLPEGLALGGMLKPAVPSRQAALGLAVAVELLTVVGGVCGMSLSPRLGSAWTTYPLALAGGFFVFLAWHALHAEWRQKRRSTALAGTCGLVFSGLVQIGLRSYLGA